MREKLREMIDQAFNDGQLTQRQHDQIMELAYENGRVDQEEKELLSKMFAAVQSGTLIISDRQIQRSTSEELEKTRLAAAKLRAIRADEEKEIARREAIKAENETPPAPLTSGENNSPSFSVTPNTPQPQTILKQSNRATTSQDDPLAGFAQHARGRRESGRTFVLHSDRILDVTLNGKVWLKTGCMLGYYGTMKFTREGFTEFGLGKLIKKSITGEGTMLTKATGQGNLFLADQGKKISVIDLQGHSLVVNGSNLLAFEETVVWDITFLSSLAGMWAGGIFNLRLAGSGLIAITTFFDPIVLRVTPIEPLMTDVNSTVAWSGSLAPQIKTDVSMQTLIGRTSGETVQMRFDGEGFVLVQPFDETISPSATNDTEKKR